MPIDEHYPQLGFQPHPSQRVWQRWTQGNPTAPAIRFGVVLQANTRDTFDTAVAGAPVRRRIPGTIDVLCLDGTKEINVQVLTGAADPRTGVGEFMTPYIGSQCCLITAAGGTCYAVGFIRTMTSPFTATDGRSVNPIPARTDAHGDWVRTSNRGQSEIRLTGGGLIVIASTPACRMVLNPRTGEWTMVSQVMSASSDGYTSRRGRLPGNQVSPDPRTLSTERFLTIANAVTATHVVVETGAVSTTAVRRVSVLSGGKILQGRETVDALGNHVGEMRSYRYGSSEASENFVLGQQLKTILLEMLDFLITHTHGSAVGPTSPAVEFLKATKIKLERVESEAFLSSFMYTQKLGPI